MTRREMVQTLGWGAAALSLTRSEAVTREQEPQKTGGFQQDICWWCMARPGVDPKQLIKETKAAGYAGIELVGREWWDAIKAEGLHVVTIAGHGTIADGLNRKENHSRIEDEIRRNLDLAAQYGIRVLICFSGNRRGMSDEEGIENTAEGLHRVAKAAEEKGVTLALEMLNSKVDHKDYHADHTAWALEVCKRVNSPRVRMLYDIYHMQIMEGDVIRTIRNNFQWIAHFHTAGVPGRRDLDDAQELNYRAIMKAIADLGYTGFVGQEFIPKADVFAAIRHAHEVCKV